MTIRDDDSGERLTDALAVLERSLETPVVPGETEPRAEGVRAAVDEACDAFRERIQEEHRSAFREIGEQDPGLLHRVERMQDEDEVLARSWQRAAAGARELCETAAAQPGDEAAFRAGFEDYVPETLGLVLRTRAQEAALRTWVSEAFQRDRGDVD